MQGYLGERSDYAGRMDSDRTERKGEGFDGEDDYGFDLLSGFRCRGHGESICQERVWVRIYFTSGAQGGTCETLDESAKRVCFWRVVWA